MKKLDKRLRLKKKIRAKVVGTASRPRLAVFRSNRFIYAELIDDETGRTLLAASDLKLKGRGLLRAKEVGRRLAELAKEKKISQVVLDRGGFRYAGRVKELAEGARAGGLKF